MNERAWSIYERAPEEYAFRMARLRFFTMLGWSKKDIPGLDWRATDDPRIFDIYPRAAVERPGLIVRIRYYNSSYVALSWPDAKHVINVKELKDLGLNRPLSSVPAVVRWDDTSALDLLGTLRVLWGKTDKQEINRVFLEELDWLPGLCGGADVCGECPLSETESGYSTPPWVQRPTPKDYWMKVTYCKDIIYSPAARRRCIDAIVRRHGL